MRNGRKNSPVSGPAVPNGAGKRGNGGEFEIIARYFAPLATNPAALGLLDEARRRVLAPIALAMLAACSGHSAKRFSNSCPNRNCRAKTMRLDAMGIWGARMPISKTVAEEADNDE